MDRFDAMQAFARVVETGSFTKAADTLQISRTSVTQQVQYLEARLRVTLLNRTTRKVNVTADGAAYYERVFKLLAELDDAETSLSNAAVLPRGRLRVDVPSSCVLHRGGQRVQTQGRYIVSVDDGNACLASWRNWLGVF